MNTIEFEHGSFSVPVEIVAAGLDIDVELVRPLMHQNKITSLCERGVGEDAGRFRLTFFHADQLFHLVERYCQRDHAERRWQRLHRADFKPKFDSGTSVSTASQAFRYRFPVPG
jgi:hypothetical protein